MKLNIDNMLLQIKNFRDVLDVMEKSLSIMHRNRPGDYESPNETYRLHYRIVEECERSMKDMFPHNRKDEY